MPDYNKNEKRIISAQLPPPSSLLWPFQERLFRVSRTSFSASFSHEIFNIWPLMGPVLFYFHIRKCVCEGGGFEVLGPTQRLSEIEKKPGKFLRLENCTEHMICYCFIGALSCLKPQSNVLSLDPYTQLIS